MFTLKLYRRTALGIEHAVHSINHVEVLQICPRTLAIRAFHNPQPSHYDSYYVGKRTAEMTALNDSNHWGWGLLENAAGCTSEHYRPHSYG